jgi:hypothetical protein
METLGKHFSSLTKAAFERHGFAQGDLLSNWAAIAGEQTAEMCRPEKLTLQKGSAGQRGGGTLVVRSAPGRALDVQYQAPQIIDRVNQFFGYAAVGAIKVLPGTEVLYPPKRERKPAEPDSQTLAQVACVSDAPLQAALAALGANIRQNGARAGRSPQVK